jgi:hypothetical protein
LQQHNLGLIVCVHKALYTNLCSSEVPLKGIASERRWRVFLGPGVHLICRNCPRKLRSFDASLLPIAPGTALVVCPTYRCQSFRIHSLMIVRPKFTVLFKPPLHQCRHAFLPTKPPLTIASSKTTTLLTEFRPTLIGIRPIRALPGAVSCMLRSPRQYVLREKIQTDLTEESMVCSINKQRRSLPFRTSRSSPKPPPTHLKTRDPLRTLWSTRQPHENHITWLSIRPNHDLPDGK